jgi:hypothetical protein
MYGIKLTVKLPSRLQFSKLVQNYVHNIFNQLEEWVGGQEQTFPVLKTKFVVN